MRGLTPYEQKLALRLYAEPSSGSQISKFTFWREKPETEVDISIFKELKSQGAIAVLAPFSLHENRAVAKSALTQIENLLDKNDLDLNWIDEAIRSIYYFCDGRLNVRYWQMASQSSVERLRFSGRHLVTSLILLACHNNGYVRAEALKQLEVVDPKTALKIALVRANDWVVPVSEAATSLIGRALPVVNEDELTDYLRLIDQLSQKTRRRVGSIIGQVEQRFASDEGVKALLKAVQTNNYRSARVALRLLLNTSVEAGLILEVTTKNKDVVIRNASFDLIAKLPTPNSQIRYLTMLARDTYAPTCKKALYSIAENFPHEAEEVLLKNLIHQNSSVRETCRFYLKRNKQPDFPKHYLGHLNAAEPIVQVAAVLGLSLIHI